MADMAAGLYLTLKVGFSGLILPGRGGRPVRPKIAAPEYFFFIIFFKTESLLQNR